MIEQIKLENISGRDEKLLFIINHFKNNSKEIRITKNELFIERSLPPESELNLMPFLKCYILGIFEKHISCTYLDEFNHVERENGFSTHKTKEFLNKKLGIETKEKRLTKYSNYTNEFDFNPDIKSVLREIETTCKKLVKILDPFLRSDILSPPEKLDLNSLIKYLEEYIKTFSPRIFKRLHLSVHVKNNFLFPFHTLRMSSFIEKLFYTDQKQLLIDTNETFLAKIKHLQKLRSDFIAKIIQKDDIAIEDILLWPEYQELLELQCQLLSQNKKSDGYKPEFFYEIKPNPHLNKLILNSKSSVFDSLLKKFKIITQNNFDAKLKNKIEDTFYDLIKDEETMYKIIMSRIEHMGILPNLPLKENESFVCIPIDKEIIYNFCKDLFFKNPYLLLFSTGILDTFKIEEEFNNYCLSHDFMIAELTKKMMGSLPFHYHYT